MGGSENLKIDWRIKVDVNTGDFKKRRNLT